MKRTGFRPKNADRAHEGLLKRSELKRGKALARGTKRLPKASVRRRQSTERMRVLRGDLWDRCRGWCERCGEAPFEHAHHIQRRSQGGKDTLENLGALCDWCHRWVHDHPMESFEVGWLKHG